MSSANEMFKLLLVDDTPENLELLTYMLEPQGYTLCTAHDGPSALEKVGSERPDLIVLDVMMPGMDGFQVCEQLKSDPQTADIPVIFLSALHSNQWKIKGLQAGSVDCVSKPFERNEVLARVGTHLRLRAAQRELQESNLKLVAEIERRKVVEAELEQANRRLQDLAAEDGLTRIANRRRLDEWLDRCWRQSARDQQPLSLVMADVDCFKRYNDHYGHQAGDACLQVVAQAFRDALKRPSDLAGRYGGEEFMAVLSHTDSAGAQVVAEEVQQALRAVEIPHEASTVSDTVTLSVGVATTVPAPGRSLQELIAAADEALYQAKSDGRNCVRAREYSPNQA